MIYDVAIVGAGIEGSAAGYYLTNSGMKNVLLLEQFDALHSRGSSHGGSRMSHNAYHEPFYVNLMNPCYEMWRDIEMKSGKELYVETGILSFGNSESIKDYSLALSKNNIDHKVLSASEINCCYSKQLDVPKDYQGIYAGNAGVIRAAQSVATLQSLFVKFGGTLLERHQVTGIIPGEVIQVETTKGTFRTRKVIVTAGAWSNKVLKTTGFPLPIRTIRTEALYWPTKCPEDFSTKEFPIFLYLNNKKYFDFYGLPIDEYHGLVRIGFHFGEEISDPEVRDAIPLMSKRKTVSQFIQKHFKGIQDEPAVVETCMYTATPDLHPIIDTHPFHHNIVIGTGFSGKGFKFAPIVGRILSELAQGITPCVDIKNFSLKRFVTPKANL